MHQRDDVADKFQPPRFLNLKDCSSHRSGHPPSLSRLQVWQTDQASWSHGAQRILTVHSRRSDRPQGEARRSGEVHFRPEAAGANPMRSRIRLVLRGCRRPHRRRRNRLRYEIADTRK